MNNGSRAINNILVYSIFSKPLCTWMNYPIYKDGYKDLLAVDIENGRVGRLVSDHTIDWYGKDKDNNKNNGYVYAKIYTADKEIVMGIHNIIMICKDPSAFKEMIESGKFLVANHKDNVPWHNQSSNLEWVTARENTMHGKMVHGIFEYLENKAQIFTNKSKNKFIGLLEGISAHDVKEWADLTRTRLKKDEKYTKEQVESFISFL